MTARLGLADAAATLVFGPQTLHFDSKVAAELRASLLESPSSEWLLDAVLDLQQHWETVSSIVPLLRDFPGHQHLETLSSWLRLGQFPEDSFPLPTTILTPLVVIAQLCQYSKYLQLSRSSGLQEQPPKTLGLCTGLISAAAASSSVNQNQLEANGAAAIRMAMVIGAYVDMRDTERNAEGMWESASIKWNSDEAALEMNRILGSFPKTYISVLAEDRRATVTTLREGASRLWESLSQSGITVTAMTLQGAFHYQENRTDAETLIRFFDSNPIFRFPGSPNPSSQSLHHQITMSILVEQCDWNRSFKALEESRKPHVVSFGQENCIPAWLRRRLGPRLVQASDLGSSTPSLIPRGLSSDDAVAVVGMACRMPGADDLEDFWRIMQEGISQHTQVPSDRFDFEGPWRKTDASRTWYGNFIQNHDCFDHKFFQSNPREASSTDPQHRLMMQTAYQAVEQSGYFNTPPSDTHIGCYIGVGLVDYERNVACHAPTAYTATGNLKSFAAGKISHYFGWTGPGLTIDTACSSSAVAIHQACTAILSGECTAALAGGVNIMTSPEWFQNLAGASFLSPTGQCKPFDQDADGYCRGEGVGAVFLKRLSTAVLDGSNILGVIGASGVYQNQNCTAITVPNSRSLSDLFASVTRKAGLKPDDITVVEAHGTGTQVGDPAEYDSVHKVFGGPGREIPLTLGSIKGLVGHTESASGMTALLKVLLMMHHGIIPPQASFRTRNPSLNASPSDNIEIPNKMRKWDVGFKAALINNYGASGSNASLVVTQAPSPVTTANDSADTSRDGCKYPFWLCGHDDESLQRYCARLISFIRSSTTSAKPASIAATSFQLSRQSNRNLVRRLVFSSTSMAELEDKLESFASGRGRLTSMERPQQPRPVILCFGGQVSTFVGLDRELHDNTLILRHNLNHCNDVCLSLGLDSIYPHIFGKTPIQDTVSLQTALFAVQYGVARTWIDSGVKVAAVVGHSFGEFTAMCIAGVTSVKDTLRMISRRAAIIRNSWVTERGSMVAIEADSEDHVRRLLSEAHAADPANVSCTIACFNAPRVFTIAGSVKAMEQVMDKIAEGGPFASMKAKRLNVTHAFHSALVEPLMPQLQQIAEDVIFREPTIPWERSVKDPVPPRVTADFPASHMRNPVHFNSAVDRLAQRYPSALWVEAGSNSTITTMASRALPSSSKAHHFQAVNLSTANALVDVTIDLWKAGLNVSFWSHHSMQASQYEPLLLPPYQFALSKHWLDLKKPEKTVVEIVPPAAEPKGLFTLLSHHGRAARFLVNTSSQKYQDYVSSHVIAGVAPLCPSTLQLVIAIEALLSISVGAGLQPSLRAMDSHAPMVLDDSRRFWLEAELVHGSGTTWNWTMTSSSADGVRQDAKTHVSGCLVFRAANDPISLGTFAKYERLADQRRLHALLNGAEADSVIKGGRNIYKAFADIVSYKHDLYRGLDKLAGSGDESVGRVSALHRGETLLDLGLADSFCQVAGIYLNTMTELAEEDMFISDRIDEWISAPEDLASSGTKEWNVYAKHHRPSDKECVSDVFVFNAESGRLHQVILGIHYVRVPKARMAKMLARSAPDTLQKHVAPPMSLCSSSSDSTPMIATPEEPSDAPSSMAKTNALADILGRTQQLLATLLGLEPQDITPSADLVELGIDSLMAMEVTREIEELFSISLDMSDVMDLTDFQSLVRCIHKNMANGGDSGAEEGLPLEQGLTSVSGVLPAQPSHVVVPAPAQIYSLGTGNGHVKAQVEPLNQDNEAVTIPAATITKVFASVKGTTDRYIEDYELSGYADEIMPKLDELCVVHIADAFDQIGCSLRSAPEGSALERIQHHSCHERFLVFIYDLLVSAGLLELSHGRIIRTGVPVPTKSAELLAQELVQDYPWHKFDHELTYFTGSRLADCLTGKADGVQLLFADPRGREIVGGMYSQSPINVAWLRQMMSFIEQLFSQLPAGNGSPIKILELGAGTGGTTAKLVELLSGLNVPFEYTVTDLSSSLVAGARKRFKGNPSLKFKVVDIEKAPAAELLHSQHIVIATNCVHATHSLAQSTSNIRAMLRPDGFLMMLEMTQALSWIDLVFGLVDGWWLFDDGRQHALAGPDIWDKSLRASGFGCVDWTDGTLPEAGIQRIIVALASSPSTVYSAPPTRLDTTGPVLANAAARQAVIDSLVRQYTERFSSAAAAAVAARSDGTMLPTTTEANDLCLLITGATGSLGSHLVAHFAAQHHVRHVICLNRRGTIEATARQMRSFKSKGIHLSAEALLKIQVLETDSAKPKLGLSDLDYQHLVANVSHIVHNAWPMSVTRPVDGFRAQFETMENLIRLADDAALHRQFCSLPSRICFQFISSIATVGHHPLLTSQPLVPELPVTAASVLPSGYGEAKLVCEKMLDETLHRHSHLFRPMAVRIAQIAGSLGSGYWNPTEHLAFVLKSSQTLGALPDLQGTLSWYPVNAVAATLGDLALRTDTPYPIYHIENPVRQSWSRMVQILAKALDVPQTGILPFADWIQRVRDYSGSAPARDNPASLLVDFLEVHFVRMSCGGLVLGTAQTLEHSETLRDAEAVEEELVHRYITRWKDEGFLSRHN